jgi:hypothetical protein
MNTLDLAPSPWIRRPSLVDHRPFYYHCGGPGNALWVIFNAATRLWELSNLNGVLASFKTANEAMDSVILP